MKKGKICEKRESYQRNLKKNIRFRNFWPKDIKNHREKRKMFHLKKIFQPFIGKIFLPIFAWPVRSSYVKFLRL